MSADRQPINVRDLAPEQLSRLFEALRAEPGAAQDPQRVVAAAGRRQWPLSLPQERLWFMEQAFPGNSAYNVTEAVRVDGRLDLAAFEAALRQLAERQSVLRTVIGTAPGGQPSQTVVPLAGWRLPVLDLSALAGDEQRDELDRRTAAEEERPFDLERGPLFRVLLCRLADDRHVLLMTLHHLVTDGWSMGVLLEEFAHLYEAARTGGRAGLAPLPIQYGDFAVWQRERLRGATLAELLDYWRRTLAGAPPALELRDARPRGDRQTLRGAHLAFTVPAEVTQRLRALGRAARATTFMTLLAAFLLVLRDRTGSDDLVVGTDVAGRQLPETERLAGLFVNQLVLRADCSGDPPFVEWLETVRDTVVGAFAHQELPFQTLVAELAGGRRLDHNPMFQVLFVLQESTRARWQVPGLAITSRTLEAPSRSSAFDLSVHVCEVDGVVEGSVRYSTDRFDEAAVAALVSDYQRVLRLVARDGRSGVDSVAVALERVRVQRGQQARERLRAASLQAVRSSRRAVVGAPSQAPTTRTPPAAAGGCDQGQPGSEVW